MLYSRNGRRRNPWNTENNYYTITDARRVSKSTVSGAENISSFGSKIYRTNGGVTAEKTGLGIILKVMAGDQVKITGESYYNLPGGNAGAPLTLAVNDLILALLGSPGLPAHKYVSTSDINAIPGNTTSLSTFISNSTPGSNTAKAYINWILLDEQLKYVSGDKDPVLANGGYKNHTQFINSPVNVTKNGYIYVYVSNESNLPVYFDNLNVTHVHGTILETAEYYPFGLLMRNLSATALNYARENKFKFNSGNELQNQEFSDGIGLELYDAINRMYDPQLGRFWQIDELGEATEEWALYSFGYDNPISFNDPDGLFARERRYSPTTDGNWAEDLPVVVFKARPSSKYIFNLYWHLVNNNMSFDQAPKFARNRLYLYDRVEKHMQKVHAMTRETDFVALEIGSFFVPTTWITKIRYLRYAKYLFRWKRAVNVVKVVKGVSVIGPRATYRQFAKNIGANFLNVADDAWTWAKNEKFLAGVVKRGDDVVFAGKFNPAKLDPNSVLAREIQYLTEHGYQWTDDLSRMIKK